jgi:hypothetical protein
MNKTQIFFYSALMFFIASCSPTVSSVQNTSVASTPTAVASVGPTDEIKEESDLVRLLENYKSHVLQKTQSFQDSKLKKLSIIGHYDVALPETSRFEGGFGTKYEQGGLCTLKSMKVH